MRVCVCGNAVHMRQLINISVSLLFGVGFVIVRTVSKLHDWLVVWYCSMNVPLSLFTSCSGRYRPFHPLALLFPGAPAVVFPIGSTTTAGEGGRGERRGENTKLSHLLGWNDLTQNGRDNLLRDRSYVNISPNTLANVCCTSTAMRIIPRETRRLSIQVTQWQWLRVYTRGAGNSPTHKHTQTQHSATQHMWEGFVHPCGKTRNQPVDRRSLHPIPSPAHQEGEESCQADPGDYGGT